MLEAAEIPPGGWYRFGTGATDFWVCPRCGVYVAAYAEIEGRGRAVVNTHALAEAGAFTQPPAPMDYGQETREAKRERRGRVWTPARVVIGAPR